MELAQLDAQRGKMRRGTFLRRAWLGAPLPRPVPTVTTDALRLLTSMSNNLNQLTRHAHATGDLDYQMLAWLVESARAMIVGIR